VGVPGRTPFRPLAGEGEGEGGEVGIPGLNPFRALVREREGEGEEGRSPDSLHSGPWLRGGRWGWLWTCCFPPW